MATLPPFGPTVAILLVPENGKYSWLGSVHDLQVLHDVGFSWKPALKLPARPGIPAFTIVNSEHKHGHSAPALDLLTPLCPAASPGLPHTASELPSQYSQKNPEAQPGVNALSVASCI